MENLKCVNEGKTSLIKDIVRNTISKIVAFDSDVVDNLKLDVDTVEYIMNMTIDKHYPGLDNLHNENKAINFERNSVLTFINVGNESSRTHDINVVSKKLADKYLDIGRIVKYKARPLIHEYSKLLNDTVPNVENVNGSIDIVDFTVPELFYNLDSVDELEILGSGKLSDTSMFLNLPNQDLLENMFYSNSDDVNDDMRSVLEKHNTDSLSEFWSNYIYDFSSNNFAVSKLLTQTYANTDNLAMAYVVFNNIISGKYVSNPPAGLVNRCKDNLEFIKKAMKKTISDFILMGSNEFLVINSMEDGKSIKIYTHSDVLESFLGKENSNINSIVGAVVHKGTKTSIRKEEVEKDMDFYANKATERKSKEELELHIQKEKLALDSARLNVGNLFNMMMETMEFSNSLTLEEFKESYLFFLNNYNGSLEYKFELSKYLVTSLIPIIGEFLNNMEKLKEETKGSSKLCASFTITELLTKELCNKTNIKELIRYRA